MILIVRPRHEEAVDGNISAVELDGQRYEDKNGFRFTRSGMADFGDQRRPRQRFCQLDGLETVARYCPMATKVLA
jgi:hypothetical protein